MFKRLLPVAVCLLLVACASTTGSVTPRCAHCSHQCTHGEKCPCDMKDKQGTQQDMKHGDKPCKICEESARASATR